MKKNAFLVFTTWFLRIAISAAFLSAVADRFGWWGAPGAPDVAWGTWQPFVDYTGTLTFFLPKGLIPITAFLATTAEVVLGLWLLVPWKTREAALASGLLLLVFGISMTVVLGIKAPLNYSVFSGAAAAFALAALAGSRSN